MIKFVLILVYSLQAPGGGVHEGRRVFTAPYDTAAACDLSGEVEADKLGTVIDGARLLGTQIDCVAMEIPE